MRDKQSRNDRYSSFLRTAADRHQRGGSESEGRSFRRIARTSTSSTLSMDWLGVAKNPGSPEGSGHPRYVPTKEWRIPKNGIGRCYQRKGRRSANCQLRRNDTLRPNTANNRKVSHWVPSMEKCQVQTDCETTTTCHSHVVPRSRASLLPVAYR